MTSYHGKKHVSILKGKLAKCISVLYKCNELLDLQSLRTLYCSLFLPHISYCCEVWGTACKKTINCIEILQKRAVRIICKESRYSHTSPLFSLLNLLKFKDLVNISIAQIMYKAYHFALPVKMQSKFESADSSHYSLRHKNKFKIKFVRTTLKHNCLSVNGIKLFNSLPDNISSTPTLLGFKKKYKCYLMSQYI